MTTAAPAEPILASSIWSAQQLSEAASDVSDERPAKRRRLLTGCASVDDVLQDGLAYGDGGVCCMSAENGAGAREVGLLFSDLSFSFLYRVCLSHVLVARGGS